MKRKFVLIMLAVAAIATSAFAGSRRDGDHADKNAAFEMFKGLAGEWTLKGGNGDTALTYKVTSGGTAVVEAFGANTEHEMITVIHPNGQGVALTHYCMLGNQPHMRASGLQGKDVAFQFVRATNMKSPTAMHMHSVTYTFIDKDTLKTDWTSFNNGKPMKEHEVYTLIRKH